MCSTTYYVGAIDRSTPRFDKLMPLPDGTSYNSYLLKGSEKVALIDSVEPSFKDELFNNIYQVTNRIDYIVSNHAEQDHSGAFFDLLQRFPEAVIVTNAKCKKFLVAEHNLGDDKFLIIKDKEELSLGDKTLQFFLTPWVHWPETMITLYKEEGLLFTCDLFGAHLAFDDLFDEDFSKVAHAAKRYYAEIMMPFSKMVAKHIKLVRSLNPRIIAPSHGPLHRDVDAVLSLHERWTSNRCEKRVVIGYVSMHGSTKRMADHLIWKLKEQGVETDIFDLSETEIGTLTMKLVNTSVFVLCSPAYLGGLHPIAANALFLLNGFKPNIKLAGFMSSHGWEEQCGFEDFKTFLNKLSVEFLNPIFISGYPQEKEFLLIDTLVEEIKSKI